MASRDGTNPFRWNRRRSKCDQRFPKPNNRQLDAGNSVYRISLVSGKVLCGGQQTLSIQCRGGNLSGKRFELRAAENWAGALLPRFSTMRDAHRPVRFLRVDRPSPSPGVSEMRGPLRRSSSAEEAFLRDQYLAMAFAQLTYRESLRDIEACLRSVTGKLYHLGFRSTVARSTLADANETRDWRIFAEFAHVLIKIARPLYADEPLGVDLDQSLYALDSTTIDLCLALFPWAKFRKHKAAVKMHTLLDLHGNIPTFIRISDGKLHDVNVLDDIAMEAGAFYVFDRGYLDFARLYRFTLSAAFFVTRTKENVVLQRRYSHPVDKSTGVRSDQTVVLTTSESARAYPDALRRISYVDAATNNHLVFLTNNFVLPALTIARIYQCRWQVELFFKWIK